jgi:hypothetical protein
VADHTTRAPASNKACDGVTDRGAENGEGQQHKGLQAGDWCYLLSEDGVQQNAEPYLIASLETWSDGQQYARFYETDTGWPLAQCERADPPTSADYAAEVNSDTIDTAGTNIDETTRVHDGPSNATTPHTPPASGTSGTSGIVAQPGSPIGSTQEETCPPCGEVQPPQPEAVGPPDNVEVY